MTKTFKITCLFLLFTFSKSFGTIQINDILKFDGKTYPINDYFLEEYFKMYPNKKPKSEMQSSNLWRGYVAEFEILKGQLFLTDLKVKVLDKSTTEKFDTKLKSVYKQFQNSGKPFKVDWVNTLLLIPLGDAKDYQTGSGVTFENYNLLEFKSGKLYFEKKFNLQKYRLLIGKKYYGFLEQEELKKLKYNLKK